MIEYDYARCPRRAFDQFLDLRIVHGLQLREIEKVRDLGLVLDEYEALVVQRKLICQQPAIVDGYSLELVSSRLAPANIVWAKCLVHKLLAGIYSVGNINIQSFKHR